MTSKSGNHYYKNNRYIVKVVKLLFLLTNTLCGVFFSFLEVKAYESLDYNRLEDSFALIANSKEDAEAKADSLGCELVFYDNNVASIIIGDDSSANEEAVKEEAENQGIQIYEEFLYYAEDFVSPYGNISDNQWYAPYIGLPEAWKYSKGSGVRVAVIDSGIDLSHPELTSAIEDATTVIGHEYYDSDSSAIVHYNPSYEGVIDNYSHGTHVSGILAAANDNVGVVGIAPECKIVSIKAIEKLVTASGTTCTGTTSMIVSAINEAISRNVDIINMSLGNGVSAESDEMLSNAVANAVSRGIVVVCAVGNSGTVGDVFPAAAEGAIGVASLKLNSSGELERLSSSRYGYWVDISAPGANIYSTVPGGGYAYKDGTSMATPIVSGAVALAKSMKQSLTSNEAAGLLYETAVDLGDEGRDDYYGHGAIDIEAMLKKLYKQLNPGGTDEDVGGKTDEDDNNENTPGEDDESGNNAESKEISVEGNGQIINHIENPNELLKEDLLYAQQLVDANELQKASKTINPDKVSKTDDDDTSTNNQEKLDKNNNLNISGYNNEDKLNSQDDDELKPPDKNIYVTREIDVAGILDKNLEEDEKSIKIEKKIELTISIILALIIITVIVVFLIIAKRQNNDNKEKRNKLS